MKRILLSISIILVSIISTNAQVYSGYSGNSSNTSSNSTRSATGVRYQRGYTRSNGTYVSGHYKTKTNNTNHDNFSTKGNVNTFTGSSGTRARDYSSEAYNYGVGRTIHTGPRGGQYYINSMGNKTYVPKR